MEDNNPYSIYKLEKTNRILSSKYIMRKKFKNFIEKQSLLSCNSKIVLGVSGGVDSMVMLHLFHVCGYSFEVAHCNFSLRAEESNCDEALVKKVCDEKGVKLHLKCFDTVGYAEKNKVSIQIAARELRYNWFSELCKNNGFTTVAIAHNKNDVVETMLINLTRGTGLKGLTGIKSSANGVIRPIIFAFRKQIEEFAHKEGVAYRNDSTNSQIKYARNRIRHNVIPELETINEGAVDNFYNTSIYLNSTWQAIEKMNGEFAKQSKVYKNDEVHYSISLLKGYPFRQVFMVEELTSYGFPPALVLDIEKSLSTQAGKIFYSSSYQLVRDREWLMLSKLDKTTKETEVEIDANVTRIEEPIALTFKSVDVTADFVIAKKSSAAVFNLGKLTFPLVLRPWHQGDWFVPFGMTGRKKVSDFLIDQKVPLHHKQNVYVLESGGQIIWVVGYRTDNRYRVNKECSKVLQVNVL